MLSILSYHRPCRRPCRRHRSPNRAVERVIASDKMKAFSNPTDRIVPNEIGGDKSFGLAGQNQSRLLGTSIFPEEEPFFPAPCSLGGGAGGPDLSSTYESSRGLSGVRHGETARWLKSTGAPTTPASSAGCTISPNRCNSETELDEEHSAGGDIDVVHGGNDSLAERLAAPHETLLTMPHELSEGAIDDVKDHDITAADWLDVTHALLGAVNESGQTFRG